ncbi:Universal stress protein G [Planctomycetes bacterium CA13]|uniref:Universal stress protein G n=1 Tax=Novipirellula herctigrandis TaxID=2527986 RepID=A0A5C5Z8C2_9BACT|nr:Universal stress protein G [Planctomycetes bacterium CA13]
MAGLHSKKAVAPVDFSDFSIASVDRALEITEEDGVVHVVHVLAEVNYADPGMMYAGVSNEERVVEVERQLRERMSDAKYAKVQIAVRIGDPGREIAVYAETEAADLVVIASHGYGFFKHMLLGSVAERVVRLAHCPVLVLRT